MLIPNYLASSYTRKRSNPISKLEGDTIPPPTNPQHPGIPPNHEANIETQYKLLSQKNSFPLTTKPITTYITTLIRVDLPFGTTPVAALQESLFFYAIHHNYLEHTHILISSSIFITYFMSPWSLQHDENIPIIHGAPSTLLSGVQQHTGPLICQLQYIFMRLIVSSAFTPSSHVSCSPRCPQSL